MSDVRLVVHVRSPGPGGPPGLPLAAGVPLRIARGLEKPARVPSVVEEVRRTLANLATLENVLGAGFLPATAGWLYAETTTPAALATVLARRPRARGFDPFALFTVTVDAHLASKLLTLLEASPDVASAFVAPRVRAPAGEGANQAYRTVVSAGVQLPGALGEGARLVDVEPGWLPHKDLPAIASVSPTQDPLVAGHGTKTLGVTSAVPNGTGCIGLAPRAAVDLVGYGDDADLVTLQNRLLEAYLALVGSPVDAARAAAVRGTVLLVEAELADWPVKSTSSAGAQWVGGVPVHADPTILAQVATCDASGIVVVLPVGNNARVDLDTWLFSKDGTETGPYARLASPAGIVVGGCAPDAAKRQRLKNTAVGATRVHAYALSEGVYTTAPGDTYVSDYNGSSSAAAIVAGVVLSLQGIRKARHPGKPPLTSSQLRALFAPGKRLGTVVYAASGSTKVGIFPDIAKVAGDAAFDL